MAVLFLDPIALGSLLGLLGYVWLVWRGTYRRWFGRSEAWTVLAWPVPLLAIGVPPLAGGLPWLAGRFGLDTGDGEVAGAVLYAADYLVPTATVAVWPPRWLLPVWARRRLTALPRGRDPDVPKGAMPAVQAAHGHGSRARWVWRVDGVAGHLWVDGSTSGFRSASTADVSTNLDVDEEMVADLSFADDGELLLATPRGGWWSRGRLDIALGEFDRMRFRGVVPWRHDGLLTVEVVGRRPVRHRQAEVPTQRSHVLVVPRRGPTEQRQDLVGRQLFQRHQRNLRILFDRADAHVDREIDPALLMLRHDRETSESVRHDLALRSDPGLAQRSLDGSHHRGDRVRLHIGVTDEGVEVVGPPVNRATDDQRRTARQREPRRLRQPTDAVTSRVSGRSE